MKKTLGILLFLCMICTLPAQPALAAYGYTSDADLENECGITFDPNGGEGSMEPLWHNGSFKLPECGFTAPEGCSFAGWRWNRELKQPGDAVYLGGVGVAVAVWEEMPADTTEPAETPVETTEAPTETTETPVETAEVPTETTETPVETPTETTEAPVETTDATEPVADQSEQEDSGMPWWGLLIIVTVACLILSGAAIAITIILKKRKDK